MRICKYVCVVSVFIVLLASTFFGLLFLKPFYKIQYETIPEIKFSNLTERQYTDYTMQIVNYFFNNEKFISIKNKNGEKIQGYFTKDEILHMVDVKNLVKLFLLLSGLFIVIFVFCIWFVKCKRCVFKTASFLGVVFVLILFLVSLADFSGAFIIFHKIFFRNSLWLLPANTKLIEMFPEKFFYDFADVWFGAFFVINGIIYFISAFLSNS